ncbi:hypothetical protein [Streptomyces sp. NPDC056337]|uniref:RapZ C-terminal domain-containing protein n=1 Tax=Streptomyces sp. NPDC056337 TaxID=3345787 RepID=UPI0035E3937C
MPPLCVRGRFAGRSRRTDSSTRKGGSQSQRGSGKPGRAFDVVCGGGRHRSVAVAEEIAVHLRAAGIGCEVEHRHIHRPILQN